MRHYYSQYNTRQGKYTNAIELRFIERAFAGMPKESLLLDIGGGGGRNAFPQALKGFQVVVTDIALPPLDYVMSRRHASIHAVLIPANIATLPFSECRFDGGLCIQVPDLVENEKNFFPAISNYLKPNAPFVVTISNRMSYKYVIRLLLNRQATETKRKGTGQTRVYLFTAAEILNRAQNAGFKIRAMEGYNWIPFSKGSNSRWIHCASIIEHRLMLQRIPFLSPWLIVCLQK